MKLLPVDSSLVLVVLAVVVVILAVWLVALQLRVSRVRQVFDALTDGYEGGNLEDALYSHVNAGEKNTQRIEDLIELSENLRISGRHDIQRIGLVRFNPFEDAGGDQSFVVALLDAEGTGIVLSSLFSRSGSRMFAKEVVAGKSTHVLTEEEVDAIDQAMATAPGHSDATTR